MATLQKGEGIGSDEATDGIQDLCAYCVARDRPQPALHFCFECGPFGRYICGSCAQFHNLFTQGHTFLRISESKKQQSKIANELETEKKKNAELQSKLDDKDRDLDQMREQIDMQTDLLDKTKRTMSSELELQKKLNSELQSKLADPIFKVNQLTDQFNTEHRMHTEKSNRTNEPWRPGQVNRGRKTGQGGGKWGRGSQQPGNAFTASLRDGNSQENQWKLGAGPTDDVGGLDELTKEEPVTDLTDQVGNSGMKFSYIPTSPKITSGTTVVNVRQAELSKQGYKDLKEWVKDPGHVYIGRDMTRHVPGAVGSKWGNPFKSHKLTSEVSCMMYRDYILNDKKIHENGKTLLESLDQLKGKVLGCWCHPEQCHGHVLQSLVEKYCCSGDRT